MKHLKKYEFIEVVKIKGTPIRFHWSTVLILLLIAITYLSKLDFPVTVFALLIIMLSHELGHKWFASMLNLKSNKIDIYPIGGACYTEVAKTEYENAFVAWGGVAIQAMIFIPALAIYYFVGADNLPYGLNELFHFLGITNLIIALINLIPIAPFDGKECWKVIPLYLKYGSILKPRKKISNYQKEFDKYLKNPRWK